MGPGFNVVRDMTFPAEGRNSDRNYANYASFCDFDVLKGYLMLFEWCWNVLELPFICLHSQKQCYHWSKVLWVFAGFGANSFRKVLLTLHDAPSHSWREKSSSVEGKCRLSSVHD